jgi:hypothetical protein
VLARAERVVASTLTRAECHRVIQREQALGRLRDADATTARRTVEAAAGGWVLMHVTDEVLRRSEQRLPVEPVRLLDAIHLASAAIFAQAMGSLTMLSLDDRVRRNATALGMSLP